MTKRRLRLFSLAAILLPVLAGAGFARFTPTAQETKPPSVFTGDAALRDLGNYRQWTRVNEKPLPVYLSLNNISLVPGNELFAGV